MARLRRKKPLKNNPMACMRQVIKPIDHEVREDGSVAYTLKPFPKPKKQLYLFVFDTPHGFYEVRAWTINVAHERFWKLFKKAHPQTYKKLLGVGYFKTPLGEPTEDY